MQKWEYCTIGPVKDFAWDLHYPRRINFSEGGRKEEQLFGGDERIEIAKIIAEQGEEGWEMVGCGNVAPNMHYLYFKRPKE